MTLQQNSVKGKRLAAAFIDYFIISTGAGILNLILTILFYAMNLDSMDYENTTYSFSFFGPQTILISAILLVVSLTIYFVYYTLIPYLSKGSTLGKLMLSLKAVDMDYQTPSFKQLLLRNVFFFEVLLIEGPILLINFLTGSFLLSILTGFITFIINLTIIIMIMATEEERGFHDLIAKTYVVDRKFDIDKAMRTNALERREMSWAVFEDDHHGNINTDDDVTQDDDEIQILKDKD